MLVLYKAHPRGNHKIHVGKTFEYIHYSRPRKNSGGFPVFVFPCFPQRYIPRKPYIFRNYYIWLLRHNLSICSRKFHDIVEAPLYSCIDGCSSVTAALATRTILKPTPACPIFMKGHGQNLIRLISSSPHQTFPCVPLPHMSGPVWLTQEVRYPSRNFL